MRIAIANISRNRLGGAEEYLARIVGPVMALGHDLAFLYEQEGAAGAIDLPSQVPLWAESSLGRRRALRSLENWHPDIVYCNGLTDETFEDALRRIAPSVFSAHGYWGTCVSGAKSFQLPAARPCTRRLGSACLVYYYPRRCGGLNPLTMLAQYGAQTRRLEMLRRYGAVVVHSAHMQQEFARHGIVADLVHYPVEETSSSSTDAMTARSRPPWRLLFIGRMTNLKGVDVLLHALAKAQPRLGSPIHLTIAGDGPTRIDNERTATALRGLPALSIEFTGWVDGQRRKDLMFHHDLLVVPSTWPEPFGMVGLEAASYGMPAVAFSVGGIPEWLQNGVNGFLAPGHPPTAEGLADAIHKSLENEHTYERLRAGAREAYDRFAARRPVEDLLRVFSRVAFQVDGR